MASGMNLFEKNDNHKGLVFVINRKLNTQMINIMFQVRGISFNSIQCSVRLPDSPIYGT